MTATHGHTRKSVALNATWHCVLPKLGGGKGTGKICNQQKQVLWKEEAWQSNHSSTASYVKAIKQVQLDTRGRTGNSLAQPLLAGLEEGQFWQWLNINMCRQCGS